MMTMFLGQVKVNPKCEVSRRRKKRFSEEKRRTGKVTGRQEERMSEFIIIRYLPGYIVHMYLGT